MHPATRSDARWSSTPEEKVAALFTSLDLPDEWQDLVFEMAGEGGHPATVEAERKRLGEKLQRTRRLALEGYVDEAMAKAEIRATETQLAALAPPDETVLDDGRELLSIPALWPQMTDEERRDIVRAALQSVSVDLQEKRVTGFLPRPHLEPLFRVMELAGLNQRAVCNWRPRSDSNRRSPP